MRRENKNPRKILFSVLIAIAFVVLAGIKLGYANIISPKQGINEYHFYNDTIENKDTAKEIQKQIILDGKSISDPGHVFKDKSNVLEKWQDEEGNDIKFDTPIEVKGNDKKIINVYPVFKNQVVITYYISGSTNDRVYMTDTITDASSYKLPVDPTIYDANKYFVNWSTSKDGKSGVYDEESLKKDIAAGKTDIKLYAITEFKHKATFITGDGASFQDQILASKDSKLDKMPEDPTRPGYEFSHWSLTEDGDPVDLNTLVLDKDINVYAVWKPVVVDYKFKVMVQNINDDGYTFHEIISARGLNGEKTSLPFKGSENPDPKVAPSGPIVEDIAKLTEKDGRFNDSYNSKDENGKMDHTYSNPQTLDYLGFHLNEEKTKQAFETIKADGSTVVPVYMDRNVHTIWVYKNASGTSYYQANWVNATDENGNIHVDLRYGQSSDQWFYQLNKDYIYYKDKSIGSFYTKAPVMGDKDVYMYRVYAKGQGFQLRFVEWDPSKFNAQINSGSLDQLKATLGTMKEIDERVSFQNTEWYMNWNGRKYRVYEPYNNNYQQVTYSWVDETDHVDDIKGFQPKTGDMSADGLQSVNVNNPAFRDYMFTPKGYGGYFNYTGTKYIDNGSYVGFLFYERKTYNIIYYSGNKKLASNPYKYEADTSDFGLNYKIGETTNPNQVFMGWYEDSTFSVEHKHENGAKMPAHDITVYAKWDSRQYEVTFHTNQDDYERDIEKITEIPEDDTLYDGKYKDDKVSEENFPQPVKPEGARAFLGWYEKNENNRFVKANLHKPIKNNDTHLYAKWKYDYLELKYDLNLPDTDKVEGTAPTDSDSYIKDAKAQVQDIGKVTVNGGKKVFVGWSETKDGSSGLILPSETVLMDKNKTLYAQWKEIPDLPTTKVTYDANGGVGDQHVVDEIITNDFHKVLGNGEGEKINYTREGYVFKGWNRDKNATKAEFQKDDEVTVTSLDESKNNYIYAIWAPIINYTTDGNGQVKEGENFVDNTKEEVELKSNPKGTDTKAKEGYKFSHWTADKEITLNDGTKIPAGEKITDEQLKQAVITEPLTFKANFVKDAPNEFNVRHEFKVSEDSPIKEMPADVKTAVDAQLPEDKKAEDGKTTTPGELKNPKDVEDKTNDGVWKFEGFKDQNPDTEAVDAKVNGADVTFEGKWKFTPNKHNVTYEYVSGTEGKELPEALKAKAPEKVTSKVKGDKVTSPVPTGDEATFRDEANKGTWTFKSYDKNDVIISNKDEKVTGTWEFTPDPEPGKYNVTHKFVSKDPNKKLPQEVLDLLPANQTGKVKGDVVKPTEPKTKEVKVKDGTWKFVSYDKDNKTVEDKDVEFTGTWEFTPKTTPTDYKVTHEFKVSEDSPIKEMPAEVKKAVDSQLPEDKKAEDGKTTTPGELKDPKDVEDKTNDGVWKFEGFKDQDPDTKDVDAKVNGADVKFEGEWKFTPNEHKVTYKFESEDPTKPLPDEVKNLLPNPEKGKVKGDKVTPTKPVPESITTKDGVWTFVGYDEESKTVGDKDVEFIGKWKFSPKPDPVTYNVNHQFKSATKGKDLPQAVKDQLPDQQTGIEDGKTVTPTSPKKEKVADTENDGTWTFEGYKDQDTTTDDVDAKVDGADVMFEGSWEFTPNKHKVTYEYVSGTKGKELPAELKAKAPEKVTGKVKGDKVTSPVPTGDEATFRDEANKGTWKFKSFDKNSVEISNQDEKVTGTWVFTPDPEYKVEHKFVSSTKGKDLPKAVKDLIPKDQTGKEDGSVVKPTAPTQIEVKDTENDGTWTFEGYKDQDKTTDEVDAKVNGADVKFEGEWKFTPNEHKVTYEYVSGTKGKELPEALKAKAPEKVTGKVKGDKVTSPVPTGKDAEYRDDVNKGTWKFKSYDKKDVTISDKDENVKGTWEFIPDVVTEYVDEDGNTIAPKENGTKDKKDIDGYEFVRTEKDDKGNTKHIYKKKTTPSPSIVTKFVDEKGNPLAMEEKGKKDKKDIPAYEFVRTYTDKYGNIVHVYKFKQTPNPTVETRYVDTEGNQILADKAGTHDPSNIEGYQFVKTEKDEKGNTVHIYKKIAPVPKVETRYVDENGNQLLPPKEGTQNQVNIDGYDYISTNKDNNGNTIHVYKKKPIQDVETRYVDTEGNQILADKAGTHDPSTIEGYQFVRTEKDEKGNTRHIYQKLAPVQKVETRYVDENGNQLLPPKEGTQNQVNIDGYDYISTNKDNNGNTIHVYKKKVITPDVVTKYVDENGNEIADTQKGKHPSKNIEGYEIITTKSDEKGNIIYVYRKKPDPTKVVTKFVDEKGNPIAENEDGKKPKKDIKGYEFVKTETDKYGNTIHIYKKKENTPKVVTKFVDEKGKTIAPNEDGKKSKKILKAMNL
ncbi:InlB B-repeat-containing protein [Anaerococcus obesiensis]|uniref:InlB B-repeat-containing protein n=1 Tax=Anaerococcus obesiensis TaxID=1287640 RepID=A0A7T7ZW79_9FIRM|nr:SHIRT domain-containing protein [Anaerococcus obesiensis]QQN56769.1 InlB B-repeat-containing protein [Anaerococcus obesiensis]